MPFAFDDILERAGLQSATLTAWIEEGWVAPVKTPDGYVFEEVDVARVGFIVELTRDLEIGEEAVPVVLSLVDQLNALHKTLRQVLTAAEDMPEPHRTNLKTILAEHAEG